MTELTEDDFFTGRFAEEIGLDIFGLRELGLDIDKVPAELFYPKEQRLSIRPSIDISAKPLFSSSRKFPNIKSSEGHIKLLSSYIDKKIDISGEISEEESLLRIEKLKLRKVITK